MREREAVKLVADELTRSHGEVPILRSTQRGHALIQGRLDILHEVIKEHRDKPGKAERLQQEAKRTAAMALKFVLDLT